MSFRSEAVGDTLTEGILYHLIGGRRVSAYTAAIMRLSTSGFAADALLQCVHSGVNPTTELITAVTEFMRAHMYGSDGPCVKAVHIQASAVVLRFALAASASGASSATTEQLIAFDILAHIEAKRGGVDVDSVDMTLLTEGVMRVIGSTVTACTWSVVRDIFANRPGVMQ